MPLYWTGALTSPSAVIIDDASFQPTICIHLQTTSKGYATVCPTVPAAAPHASFVTTPNSAPSSGRNVGLFIIQSFKCLIDCKIQAYLWNLQYNPKENHKHVQIRVTSTSDPSFLWLLCRCHYGYATSLHPWSMFNISLWVPVHILSQFPCEEIHCWFVPLQIDAHTDWLSCDQFTVIHDP